MTTERRPGKFEGCDDQDLGERLHAMTMDGCDDELGLLDEAGGSEGWHGLLLDAEGGRSFIVHEDAQGFFTYEAFDDEDGAGEAWARFAAAIEREEEETT